MFKCSTIYNKILKHLSEHIPLSLVFVLAKVLEKRKVQLWCCKQQSLQATREGVTKEDKNEKIKTEQKH